jgi:CRISPR-associated protein Cmr6
MNAEFVPRDTKAVLQLLPVKDCSRSLYFDRFSRPDLAKAKRQQFFNDGFTAHTSVLGCGSWAVTRQRMRSVMLYAQLKSRLMVNMAGGVMENAGLSLDRFGLPYLPGSAVKGCARRAALAALQEWCETGEKPAGTDNYFSDACEQFETPAAMLAAIALVFGWCDHDWFDGSNQSDFLWACGQNHEEIWRTTSQMIAAQFCLPAEDGNRETPWKSLPNFAGSVSFLPAYLVDIPAGTDFNGMKTPAIGKLELDVGTCHHPDYYGKRLDRKQKLLKPVATDDEDPNPVFFPTVAPGHVFAFVLRRLREIEADEKITRTWLACGLQTFGLGAKTAAGYGWFDSSESVHASVTHFLLQKAERERKTLEDKAAKDKAQAEARAKDAEKAARETAFAGLSADERADKEVELMSPAQFDNKVRAFHKEPKKGGPADEEKKAIVRALRGLRLGYWQEFKLKAIKGDPASAANAIREVSKQIFPGKEGKMP